MGRRATPPLAQLLVCNGIDATTGEYLLPAMDVHPLARVATGVRLEGAELGDLVLVGQIIVATQIGDPTVGVKGRWRGQDVSAR